MDVEDRTVTTSTVLTAGSSPYGVLAAATAARPTAQLKQRLLMMSRMAEATALAAPRGAVVLSVLQESRHYTRRTSLGYQILARRGVQVVLFAHGWAGVAEPMPGLHLVGLAAEDPLCEEWDVLVCTPGRRFGFAARDEHAAIASDMDRSFSWLTTSDPQAILTAASGLLARVPGLGITIPGLG